MLKTGNIDFPVSPRVNNNGQSLSTAISASWSKIAPFWPLKNLIAVNPVAGFEDLTFEEALMHANALFQQREMPVAMQQVNRESIKWLQVFFDRGQATIRMPMREKGLLKSTLSLMRHDKRLHNNDGDKIDWLTNLPQTPKALIAQALFYLDIEPEEHEPFLTLMLTTLPGWAAHVRYRAHWADAEDAEHAHTVTQAEYLAFRLVITCLLWPEAKELLNWHREALENADATSTYSSILGSEAMYRRQLTKKLAFVSPPKRSPGVDAQLVFCIDVRSEPFRRALEAQGNYTTFGFAGFFGIPVSIGNTVTGESYASCPVLLKPACEVRDKPGEIQQSFKKGHRLVQSVKKLYQSLKYTFTTPFSLVEAIGLASGVWMAIRSLTPAGKVAVASMLKKSFVPEYSFIPDISSIPFAQQVAFAGGALSTMGLTENFAPLVVFCGHGSTTDNNAYSTALDCGACGGRHGAPNARILASILNDDKVRNELRLQHIDIPAETIFVAAEHNTTTDQVDLLTTPTTAEVAEKLQRLKKDLEKARSENSFWRCMEMGIKTNAEQAKKITALRANDWAQVRPEWGLARNAAFIVGPRWLTKDINLEGRSFLHSYEWEKDENGLSLTTILTAPMVVAQWINAQYLFSTLDNVAFGGGSKVTMNITGKIGVMQGNASDLMHGLPLQSVYKSDDEPYHQPVRLTAVVYAPKDRIDRIIKDHEILQKLFGNGWVHLISYDPEACIKYRLMRDFTWTAIQ
jgi:uncharacterized protein